MTERYIELHAASAFSFLEGASQPEELIKRAVELEMPAMALLDRNGVYGSARFHTSGKRNNIRAHVGAEVSVSNFGARLTPPAWLPHQHSTEPARLPLLCESRTGYQNLCQLITRFKMRETTKTEGAANFGDLQQYASGLICLTGGDEGPVAAALANGGEQAARAVVEELIGIFGPENVYVELQRHHEREQEWRNQAALRIARSLRIAMTAANFSGAEAEELRRAVGMRRSWERMKNLEWKLRAGMTANGISPTIQDNIVENISSFALYGFPESHAASFALIAYASAYFKVKYLAAFTCAILNNQPMGFYAPAVLVKDAQRHGLRVKPIDVQVSHWSCTIEQEDDGTLSLRLGLGYAKGLRNQSAESLVEARDKEGAFHSAEDLALRVRSLNRRELTVLAGIGALNQIDGIAHRRDALWQVERAGKLEGPLLRQKSEWLRDESASLPLQKMGTEERLVADYAGTGLTIGKHPMYYRRPELRRQKILSAVELQNCPDGKFVRTAGCVIARQRPGTAKGFIFLSMEDETGIANVIITPDLYERERLLVTRSKFLWVEGRLQNQDNVVHVKALRLFALSDHALELRSHDFH